MWTVWEGRAGGPHGDFGGGVIPPSGIYGADEAPFPGPQDIHRSLWAAVILRALQDATRTATSDEARRIRGEARGWFVDGGGDFHRVCRMAGFDPSWVRGQALKLLDLRRPPDPAGVGQLLDMDSGGARLG